MRHVQPGLRGEVPGAPALRPAHRRVQNRAIAGRRERRLTKVDKLAGRREIEPPQLRGVDREHNLWLAEVRRYDRVTRILQGLKGLYSREQRERLVTVGDA